MCSVFKREFTLKKFSLNFTYENLNSSVNKSWILPSRFLMLFRLAIAIFCVVTMGLQINTTKWYIFLTNWSFLLLTLAFVCLSLVSVIHVVQEWKGDNPEIGQTQDSASNRDVERVGNEDNFERLKWYQKLTWLLWIVSANAAVLVTILYWILVFKPPTDFRDISIHALNSLFVLIELFTGSIPFRLLHVVYVMIFTSIYSIFTVVYWAAGGVNDDGESFIYEVTDYENGNGGTAAGILVSTVFLVCPLVQLLLFGFYGIRCYLKNVFCQNDEDEGYRMS